MTEWKVCIAYDTHIFGFAHIGWLLVSKVSSESFRLLWLLSKFAFYWHLAYNQHEPMRSRIHLFLIFVVVFFFLFLNFFTVN